MEQVSHYRGAGADRQGDAPSPQRALSVQAAIAALHAIAHARGCDNAMAVAQWLVGHHKVAWVSYPGLPGDRYHNLARKYVPNGAGSVFTFGLKGGYEAGVKLVSNVKLFSHLANIGDTRSLIIHPASTTHRQLTDAAEDRRRRRPRRGAPLDRAGGQGRHHRRPRAGAGGVAV